MKVTRLVDVTSRGEVARQLLVRRVEGLIRDCTHIGLEHHPAGYVPRCDIDWASKEEDNKLNAKIGSGEFGNGYQISWPRCPGDCPRYDKAENFEASCGRDQYERSRESRSWKAPSPTALEATAGTPTLAGKPTNASPEKHTARWLWENIPMNLWLGLGGILVATFVAGIQLTRIQAVRDLFGLPPHPAPIAAPSGPASSAPAKVTPAKP